jgi:site-specific DNA recombinase
MIYEVTAPPAAPTDDRKLLSQVKGALAEYERKKILRRTELGRRGRADKGSPPGSCVTLGYRYIKLEKGGRYEIDPEGANVVRLVFYLYVVEGLSLYGVAKHLNTNGIPTPTQFNGRRFTSPSRQGGTVWRPDSLAFILKNETYIGTMYYGRRSCRPGKHNPDKNTRWTTHPEENWIAIPVPPIIPLELFKAAQEKRRNNKRRSHRNQGRPYLLGGQRLQCGSCGYTMIGETSRQGKRFYRCHRHGFIRDGGCRRTVDATIVEGAVWEQITHLLHTPDALQEQLDTANTPEQVEEYTRSLDDARGALARIEAKEKRLLAVYLDGTLEEDTFRATKGELAKEKQGYALRLTALEAQGQERDLLRANRAQMEELCTSLAEELSTIEDGDVVGQQRLLDALGTQVRYLGKEEGIEVEVFVKKGVMRRFLLNESRHFPPPCRVRTRK